MSFEESGVLANNVHDVAGHDGLVVLAALHLGEAEEILDDSHEEALLRLLVHCQGDGSDGPTEDVAVVPRPFGAVHLLGELLGHDVFRVHHVEVGEIDETLADGLVELHGVAFLDELAHNLALVVLHDENLLRSYHLLDHDGPQV